MQTTEAPGGGTPAPAASLPVGARDVLPVEAAELRAAEDALRRVFGRFGYREVRTPVLEFAAQLERGQGGPLSDVFRLFDPSGRVVVLRPDLTIPVARLLATRLGDHPGPLRVSYTGPAFRVPRPGRPLASEHRQAGAELVGVGGPEADAEAVVLLAESLRAAGLVDLRIGVGDVSLTAAVLDALGVPDDARVRLAAAVAGRDLVAWRRGAEALALPGERGELLAGLPAMRGGRDVTERIAAVVPEASEACARLERMLALVAEAGAGDLVLVDLGILRDWPYYSGLTIEAYAAGAGAPVAQGGRYDGLSTRFGHPRPAVGFSIELEVLHRALAAADARPAGPRDGVVLVGGLDTELGAAAAARAAGVTVVALPSGDDRGDAVAEAEGWRYVARRDGDVLLVRDRTDGAERRAASIREALA